MTCHNYMVVKLFDSYLVEKLFDLNHFQEINMVTP